MVNQRTQTLTYDDALFVEHCRQLTTTLDDLFVASIYE